jgi:putative endonuclease
MGFELLGSNVYFGHLEIDLLARDGERLLVVEVRYRKPGALVGALSSIGKTKQARLVEAARRAFAVHTWAKTVRIDVMVVSGKPGMFESEYLPGAIVAE